MAKQSKPKQSVITISILKVGLGKTISVVKSKNLTKKEQLSVFGMLLHDLKTKIKNIK